MKKFLLHALLGVLLLPMPGHGSAHAASGAWSEKEQVSVRLLFGESVRKADGGRWLVAGLHFKLKPGWKLYWRTPGDSGLPLQYRTGGTANLEDIRLHWPAPRRFVAQQGQEAFGYEGEAVLPITAKVTDAAKPAALKMQLHFGVCQELCVPVSLPVELEVQAQAAADAEGLRNITQYGMRVPRDADSGFVYAITWQEETKGGGALKVNIAARGLHFTVPDLFIEGPRGIRFPRPRVVLDGDRGAAAFTVPYELTLPGMTLGGQTLTFTLVNGYEAVQATTTMPMKPSGGL